jgi:hypothetical protein
VEGRIILKFIFKILTCEIADLFYQMQDKGQWLDIGLRLMHLRDPRQAGDFLTNGVALKEDCSNGLKTATVTEERHCLGRCIQISFTCSEISADTRR